jgi:glycosyltransferase involved in cell wall biosynthesis
MKIAILGIRGIPANYGGFETFAEELSWRLAARGHEVTVYGRSHYVDPSLSCYRGVHLAVLPTLRSKYFDTVVHTCLCVLDSLGKNYDCALICNAANAIFSWVPRLSGTRVALNVDGLERKRKKWNALGRLYYGISEWLATWMPDAIVTDAVAIQEYYRSRYGTDSAFIPYGATVEHDVSEGTLSRLGLEPKRYYLYVSRLEPENNAHLVIRAFEKTDTRLPLVIVGDAPYSAGYVAQLKATRDPRIRFAGGVYGRGYHELQANALCYVHATEVGGTHPALVEAMGHGNTVIVHETAENREVVGEAGILVDMYDETKLAEALQWMADGKVDTHRLGTLAQQRVQTDYSWDAITTAYEKLFDSLMRN